MFKNSDTSIQKFQSQVIDFLRFPLIVGVIFIHNQGTNLTVKGQIIGTDSYLPYFDYCSKFFSSVAGSIAVPFFFFLAGYLFFCNIQKFDNQSYLAKMKSRAKTLLVPYLFWNLISFAAYYIISIVPHLNNFLHQEIDFHRFVSYFWDNDGATTRASTAPIAGQFWFIRDLMIAIILTPVIYFLALVPLHI